MWSLIKSEPVLFQGVVQAALALGVAFGLNLSPEATGALLAFSAAVLSFATRTHVTPLANPRTGDGTPLVAHARKAA